MWTQAALRLFPASLLVNGRRVLVGDGLKVPKRGKKMPAVKRLHQQSDSNTKPEYIMGHSLQAVSLLVQAAQSVFAVPLAVRIHEGLLWSNRDRRTLLDKMLMLLGTVAITQPYYFIADAYYAAGKIVRGLLAQSNHLITRVRSNAVAFMPYRHHGPNNRRPCCRGSFKVFDYTQRALDAEHQLIVHSIQIVEILRIADQSIGNLIQFQQMTPVLVRARQP